MSQLVRYEVRDRVAVITVDNPPVNALSAGVPEGITEEVERACGDSAADAIVLIGAGTTFIAGADINIFKQLKTREQSMERSQAVHARLKQLEDTGKPLVAAIHGHALGGGLEFAMACHHRVALATATVLSRVNTYRQQFGDYWRPSPLLEQLAIEGRGFDGDAA